MFYGYTICSMDHKTCSMNHRTWSMAIEHVLWTMEHALLSIQYAFWTIEHVTGCFRGPQSVDSLTKNKPRFRDGGIVPPKPNCLPEGDSFSVSRLLPSTARTIQYAFWTTEHVTGCFQGPHSVDSLKMTTCYKMYQATQTLVMIILITMIAMCI